MKYSRLIPTLFIGAIASFCTPSFANTLTNGLLVHLTFDNANFTDDSGNHLDGVAQGSPTIVPGIIGAGAVSVTTLQDGSEIDYVTLGYPPQLQFDTTTSFSISFWTSYTNQMDDPPFISNKNWGSSSNPGWGIFTQNNGNFRVNVTDENGSADKESTTATPDIRDGKWHHIAVTFDRGAEKLVTIYTDGAVVDSDSLAAVQDDIDTLSLGYAVNIGQDGTGAYTDGGSAQMIGLLMDDMGIWGRVLSASEVSAMYQAGLGGSNILQVVTKLTPVVGGLSPTPGSTGALGLPGLAATLTDKDTAVVASTVKLSLDSVQVAATVTKSNGVTSITFPTTTLLAPATTHTVTLSFGDNNVPANQITTNWTFTVLNYPTIPATAAQPPGAVNTNNVGFLMRVSQIDDTQVIANDGSLTGNLPGCVALAEAQLAGLLVDPMTGHPQADTTTPGPLANGAYAMSGVVNFSYDGSDEGNFNSVNGFTEQLIPGVNGADDANLAVEITTYLNLSAGFHQFGVNSSDGFRMTIGANAHDALAPQVGLYDIRSDPNNTSFSFYVTQAGIYAARIVWFRQGTLPDNTGDAGLELYSITSSGQKVLINDPTNSEAVASYQSSTAAFPPYIKYAGPTAFISTYRGNDFGVSNVQVQIHDGSAATVSGLTLKLNIDGSPVVANVSSASGVTTVSYTPPGLQLKRTVHTGQVSYTAGGTTYTNSWQFNSLRNYVLPAAVSSENFDEVADGGLPTGWTQTNYTSELTPGIDFSDAHSDAFLGWTVVNTGDGGNFGDWGQRLNVGLYQELNGKFFDATTNPLVVNQFLYAESDNRGGQQIQYVYTPKYNLTGKTGTVIAFDSSYEQNQNNMDGLEYTVDGTNWQPVVYLLMGDSDNQQQPQIIHDGNGVVNVAQTMAFPINPKYTNAANQVIGGTVGAFIGPPITQALEPYIEGRVNDDQYESMRFEAYAVPLADNKPSVQFRLFQVGTGSWFWGIDNWGVYSVPSIAPANPGSVAAKLNGANLVLTWTASANIALQQNASLSTTNWADVAGTLGAGTYTVTNVVTKSGEFYRLHAE